MPSCPTPGHQSVTPVSLSVTVHRRRNAEGRLFVVRALGRTAPAGRGDHARREPPRRDQEPGMSPHAVLRPDGQALDLTAADQVLPGGRLTEAAVPAQRLDRPGPL